MIKLALWLAVLLIGATEVFSQGFQVEGKTPASLASLGDETFTSIEGRFAMALPKMFNAYQPISLNLPAGRMTGSAYMWKLLEGQFVISYLDRADIQKDQEVNKELLSTYRQQILAKVNEANGKVLNDSSTTIGGYQGHEIKAEVANGMFINRLVFVGPRLYQVLLVIAAEQRSQETLATKTFNSFQLLSANDIEAEIKKMVKAATPAALPQEPVAKKQTSDAEDEGLKGKVNVVASDDEDLSGTWSVRGRKPASVDYYNERGNRTKHELYDYRGNPMEITVYGYVDGDRVSTSKMLQYEYNPPPMMMPPPPAGQAAPKRDTRYGTKFKYKYDDKGNLIETELYGNDGKLSMRYVYSLTGRQKDRLVYSSDGSLNQKYLELYDDKGQEIEMTGFNVKTGAIQSKYAYTYELDRQGNWIKRTTSKIVVKDGKPVAEPYYITYRTISYY